MNQMTLIIDCLTLLTQLFTTNPAKLKIAMTS